MNERDPANKFDNRVAQIVAELVSKSTVLELSDSRRLIVPTNILFGAGIVSGSEADEFDPDIAVETVLEYAFDPTLN